MALRQPTTKNINMQTTVTLNHDVISIKVPIVFKRYRGKTWLTLPENNVPPTTKLHPNESFVKALAKAYHWQHLLDTGKFPMLRELIKHVKVNSSYASRILRLNLLAPDIKQAILEGKHPPELSQRRLLSPFPLLWEEQRRHFGFAK